MINVTSDEQVLGMAVRIDPIHHEVDAIEGVTTYRHHSLYGEHTFHGWLSDGPEKTIPNPIRPDRSITIGGQLSETLDGIKISRVYCEGCGMMVGSVYFLR